MIALAPPAPYVNLGPFKPAQAPVDFVQECCDGPSFTLGTDSSAAACSGAQVSCARPMRLVGKQGWRVLRRCDSHSDVVLILVQVLGGQESAAISLTSALPFARVYIDMALGFSVFVFVGLDPLVALGCPCPPKTASFLVTGACDSLVPAPALPCPADNVGTACPVPCAAAMITAVGISADGDALTLQVALSNPVLVASDQSPVILRITNRVTQANPPDTALTAELAVLDLRLAFVASVPGFLYLLLSYSQSTGAVSVSATHMFTGQPVPEVATSLRVTGPFPVSATQPNCSLVVYSLCNNYTALGGTVPSATIVSQVVWYTAAPTRAYCAPVCSPCVLELPGDAALATSRASRDVVQACNTYCLDPAFSLVVVTSVQDLLNKFQEAPTYQCVFEDTTPPPTPVVVLLPTPYLDRGLAPTASPVTAPPAATAPVAPGPRIVSWRAPGEFQVWVPSALLPGAWITVGDLQFRNGGAAPIAGPFTLTSNRLGTDVAISPSPASATDMEVNGSPARAQSTLPPRIFLYAPDPADDMGTEVLVGGLVCGVLNVPAWVPDSRVLRILDDPDASTWSEFAEPGQNL